MKIVQHQLHPFSKHIIRHMWMVEEENGLDIKVNSFPVGYPFLNIISGHPFTLKTPTGETINTRSYLAGAKTSLFSLHMKIIRRAITVQLQPYAMYYLFNRPASEFHDQILPIAQFDIFLSRELEETIDEPLPTRDILNKFEHILFKKIKQPQVSNRIIPALQAIYLSHGNIPVAALVDTLNMSQRRLQQLFSEQVGMSPKKYCNIIKLQYHTYQLLKNAHEDTVIPRGFYDQSHYIHVLKKQTGMLPGAYKSYVLNPSVKQAYLNSNIYFNYIE